MQSPQPAKETGFQNSDKERGTVDELVSLRHEQLNNSGFSAFQKHKSAYADKKKNTLRERERERRVQR